MHTKLFFSFLLAGIACACSPQEKQQQPAKIETAKPTHSMQGQVFISTKGGQNIKLGTVEVFLLEASSARSFGEQRGNELASKWTALKTDLGKVTEMQKGIEEARKKLFSSSPISSSEFQSKEAALKSARTNDSVALAKAMENFAQYVSDSEALQSTRLNSRTPLEQLVENSNKAGELINRGKVTYQAVQEGLARMERNEKQRQVVEAELEMTKKQFQEEDSKLAAQLKPVTDRREILQKEIQQFPKLDEILLDFTPTASAKTLTDAEGEFRFSGLTESSYVLYARANRVVGDSEENYAWLVMLELPQRQGDKFLLSNHNLISSSGPGSVIQIPQK